MKWITLLVMLVCAPGTAARASQEKFARPRVEVRFVLGEQRFRGLYGLPGSGEGSIDQLEADTQRELRRCLGNAFGFLDFVGVGRPAEYLLRIALESDALGRPDSAVRRSYFELDLVEAVASEAWGEPTPMRLEFRPDVAYLVNGTTSESLKKEIIQTFRWRTGDKRDDIVSELFSYVPMGRSLYMHVRTPSPCVGVVPFSFCELRARRGMTFMLEVDDGITSTFHGAAASDRKASKVPDVPPRYSRGILVTENEQAVRARHAHTPLGELARASGELARPCVVFVTYFIPAPKGAHDCGPAELEL